jgi:hypothetical protein
MNAEVLNTILLWNLKQVWIDKRTTNPLVWHLALVKVFLPKTTLMITWEDPSRTEFLIQCSHCSGKPLAQKMFSMKSQLIVSNVFCISALNIARDVFDWWACYTTCCVYRNDSVICLPLTNHVWLWYINSWIINCNLTANTFDRILWILWTKLIGLNSLGFTAPGIFEMRIIKEEFKGCREPPKLRALFNVEWISRSNIWMNLLVKLSSKSVWVITWIH